MNEKEIAESNMIRSLLDEFENRVIAYAERISDKEMYRDALLKYIDNKRSDKNG